MKLVRRLHRLEQEIEDLVERGASAAQGGDSEARVVLRNIGWVSAGIATLAIGVVIGRELRQRYKFTRRTPYDVYAHAGDMQEFGVGI